MIPYRIAQLTTAPLRYGGRSTNMNSGADTQPNTEKPKEPFFCQRIDRIKLNWTGKFDNKINDIRPIH